MLTLVFSFLFSQVGVLLFIVVGLIYYHTTTRSEVFKKQGIKFVNPLPLIGNMFEPMMKKIPYSGCYKKLYDAFPNESVIGVFEMLSQSYMIKDPELLKQIQVKEFDSFMNHRFDLEHDPIFGKNLLMMRDQRWKEMRSVLTPAFTGSKMRFLFDLIRKCAQNGVDHINSEAKSKGGLYEFEAKDLLSRFANDIIATSAFGLEVNSLKEPKNEFYTNANHMLKFTISLTIKFFLSLSAPIILKLFKLQILDLQTSSYFKGILLETIKYREQNKSSRPDMVQLLLQTKTKGRIDDDHSMKLNTHPKHDTVKWTDDDLVAQLIVFFIAGYDTVSSLFSFMAYELAKNQEVQDRVWEEVDSLTQRLEGKDPSYDDINKLTYLEMVMNETLRMWPPTMQTDRLCKKKTTLEDSNGKKITLNPGESALIQIYSIHHDANNYPEPEKFDPERFSDDNKGSINPYVFQPFGQGPRSCIGNRFGIMECKTVFYYIISKFKIQTTSKTEIPMKLQPGVFQNIPANGIWLQFKARE